MPVVSFTPTMVCKKGGKNSGYFLLRFVNAFIDTSSIHFKKSLVKSFNCQVNFYIGNIGNIFFVIARCNNEIATIRRKPVFS